MRPPGAKPVSGWLFSDISLQLSTSLATLQFAPPTDT